MVLGPTRWQIVNVGYSPPSTPLAGGHEGWGHIPQTPCHGGFAPLDPPYRGVYGGSHPRLQRVCHGFGSHSFVGLRGRLVAPYF